MKSYFLAFVVLILAVDAVKALECYQCEYLEGADPSDDIKDQDWYDKSCKAGKKPNKKLAITCPSGYDVCIKVFMEGRLSGKDVKDTSRGCGIRNQIPGYTTDKCEGKNSSELSSLVGYTIPDDFKGNLCLCSEDKCNSSSMLKVTQSLMFFGLCVFSSKFMGLY